MKKFLKYILFISIFTLFLSGSQNIFAQNNDNCEVNAVEFSPLTTAYKDTTLTINSKNCNFLKVQMFGIDSIDINSVESNDTDKIYSIDINSVFPDRNYRIPENGTLELKFKTGEDACYRSNGNYDCNIFTVIKDAKDKVKFSSFDALKSAYNVTGYPDIGDPFSNNFTSGIALFNCDGICDSIYNNWKLRSSNEPRSDNCVITEDPLFTLSPFTNEFIQGNTGTLEIHDNNACGQGYEVVVKSLTSNDENYLGHFVNKTGDIKITFLTNGHACKPINNIVNGSKLKTAKKYDCKLYVEIYKTSTVTESGSSGGNYSSVSLYRTYSGKLYSAKNIATSSIDEQIKSFKNTNYKGILFTECDPKSHYLCKNSNTEWKVKMSTGIEPNSMSTPSVETPARTLDKNSPCYDEQTKKYLDNCYEFLAPIKGIEINPNTGKIDDNFIPNDNGRIAIRDVRKYELGDYINKIFQLAISILGILSVIMIIVAGVEYMTVESIYGKSAAKQRIIGAVTGLMLSLGIFVILHTINPQLLQINFGSNLSIASVDEKPTQNKDGSYNIGSSGKIRPFKVNGIIQKKGMPWKPENTDNWKTLRKENNINESIINDVYINKAECSKIGNSCTSTYFDEQSFKTIKSGLEKLQKDCGCKLTISGGSEFWFHKTHGPNSTKIDISNQIKFGVKKQDLEKLAKTLTDNTYASLREAINSGKYRNVAVDYLKYVNIYAEDGDHPHWHLTFK